MFAVVYKAVECVEKFFFRLCFTCDELNIVNQKQINVVSVFVVEFVNCLFAKALDKFVCKIFCLNISNSHFRIISADFVADSVEEVGFAQTYGAVDEKRVE